jgi:bacteriocin-like protein
MSDEIKKPEEIVESVKTASPEPPKVLSESDLKQVVGGLSDITIMKVLDKSSPL